MIIQKAFNDYCETKIIKTESGEIHISPVGHYGSISKEQFIKKLLIDDEFYWLFGSDCDAFKVYLKNFVAPKCPEALDVQPDYYAPISEEWFIKSCQENNSRGKEFRDKWKGYIRELNTEERQFLEDFLHPARQQDWHCFNEKEVIEFLDYNLIPKRTIIT